MESFVASGHVQCILLPTAIPMTLNGIVFVLNPEEFE